MTQRASDLINSHEALIQAVEAQQAAAEALLQDGQSQQQVHCVLKYKVSNCVHVAHCGGC